jgi:predicted kinase
LLSGSGKSTLSKSIVASNPSFTRLSVDQQVATHHGIYGIDYKDSKYNGYLSEARNELRDQLLKILNKEVGKGEREGEVNVVLDFAFAFKEDREEWKQLVGSAGGRWVLVYIDAGEAESAKTKLWARIKKRRENGVNADSAYEITEEVLDMYLEGFEVPKGEGEVVLQMS